VLVVGLHNGVRYRFHVDARNAFGTGAVSDASRSAQ
jgi:hypothetical protein